MTTMTDRKIPAKFSTMIFVPEDVETHYGNLLVPAGMHPATPDEAPDEWALVAVPSCTVYVAGDGPCYMCAGTGTRPKGGEGESAWDPDSDWARECGGCNVCAGTGETYKQVGLPAYCYTRVEGAPIEIPEHDCYECARSGVVVEDDGSCDIYCGVCGAEVC